MQLNPALFWDTNPKNLDFQKHARYIIMRVVMYGKMNEWQQVLNFYGKKKIAEEMIQERELDIKTVHYLSIILGVPLKNFRCYSEKR